MPYLRVPWTGNEKDSLRAALDRHRAVVLWKLDGLDDEQLRRPMTPSGTSLLGLVKHLAVTESGWFCETFGRPAPTPPSTLHYDEADEESDLRAGPDEPTADVIVFYRECCAAANAALDDIELETVGTSWDGNPVSMRWVAIHMVEENARHAGHLDILRELVDGATGDHDRR